MKKIFTLALAVLTLPAFSQNTDGSLEFSFTTLSNNTGFSPKHILAVWVETESGDFVKSLKVMAAARKQYLYTWNAASAGNTTDAVTGSTLTSHQGHTVSWNITDINSNTVADGNYKIMVEYTSEHAQGPLFSLSFSKAGEQLSLNPGNETYFNDISMVYTPSSVGVQALKIISGFSVYPNPVRDQFKINMQIHQPGEIEIALYDLSMRKIEVLHNENAPEGDFSRTLTLNQKELVPGQYFIVVSSKNQLLAGRLTFLK